jgi:hypothetical protein
VLQSFWHATGWKEKAAFVREADRTGPLMQEFYEKRRGVEPVCGQLEQSASFRLRGQEVLLLVHSSQRSGGRLEAALLRDGAGNLKLDWESFVGWGEKDFPLLKKERPVEDVMLRVFAARSSYYNYEFTDETRYVAVQLYSPDSLSTLHAYCERSSALGTALEEVFARSQSPETALMVRIAYPQSAQSDHAVLLKGLVSDRWIVVR